MIPHGVFLQPRNQGTPSWPTDPQPAAPGDAGAAPPSPTPAPSTTVQVNGGSGADGGSVTVTTTPGSGYLNQELCEQANRNGLIAAGGYAFGASLVGIILFMVMRKKLWGTAFTRYLTAVLTAAILSTVLVAWDPIRADVLTRCMDPNQGFAQYVFLGSMLAARALVLGLVPSVLVTLVGCFVANRT